MGGKSKKWLNPVKAVKSVFGGDKDDSSKKAYQRAAAQIEEQRKLNKENDSQQQRKENQEGADQSALEGLGYEGGPNEGLMGLGGTPEDKKLGRKKLLGG